MKKLSVVFLLLLSLFTVSAQRVEIDDCRVTLYYSSETVSFMAYGNVYVETDPEKPVDLYVKIVNQPRLADFCVFKTANTPSNCGEWRFVNNREDAKFTIRYVTDQSDCNVFFVKDPKEAGWYYLLR